MQNVNRASLAALCLVVWTSPASAAPGTRRADATRAASSRTSMSVNDLLAVQWVSQVTLSPDGKQLAFVVTRADREQNKRRSNIYLLATQGTGTPRQLTNGPGTNNEPAFSPDGKRLAFVSSRGEGEPQIWIIPLDGGEAVQLTHLSTGASGPLWSPDGKHLAFASSVYPQCKDERCNAQRVKAQTASKVQARVYDHLLFRHWNEWRDERRSHVLMVPVTGGAARDLTPGPADAPPVDLGSAMDYAFSPDGKHLAYVSNTDPVVATSTNNDVFEVAVSGGAPRRLSSGKGNDYAPRYSPDGKRLAYLSMAQAGYEADRPRIIVRDRQSGKEVEWSRGFEEHPIELRWSPAGDSLVFSAPQKGRSEIFLATAAGVQRVSQGLFARDVQLAPGGRRLFFRGEAADRPPEVATMELGGAPRELTQLNGWLRRKIGFERAEHVWFEGAGKERVHALLLRPPGFQKGKRYPAVVMAHGGPQSATGDDFHPRWNLQMLASEGYLVFAVNFHGSLGFGQRFAEAISGDWGGRPYEDVMRGVDWLASQPFVQPQKICAAGASYGGYLVNWMATRTQRFRCFITHAGVFNVESKYGSTEELWFPEWEFKGTPWSNRAGYRKWSPHSYAERLRTPMLVIHGQRDYRVPVEQAFQLYTALQRQGVPSRLLYFPDEDHFVQKPQNIELWWATMRDWLGRYLR